MSQLWTSLVTGLAMSLLLVAPAESRPVFCTSFSVENFYTLRVLIESASEQTEDTRPTAEVIQPLENSARDLDRAIVHLQDIIDFLERGEANDPSVISYVEAGHSDTKLVQMLRYLHSASYWAALSTIALKTPEAYAIYGKTVAAMRELVALWERVGRCYINAYYP